MTVETEDIYVLYYISTVFIVTEINNFKKMSQNSGTVRLISFY